MKFGAPLVPARLITRYKRFLVDVRMNDGSVVTAHCPNSGSMKGCLGDDWPVRLSESDNPGRKHRHTLEMVHNGRCWIGVNTHLANRVAAEAIADGTVSELAGYGRLRTEVPYGERSRIDILLEHDDGSDCLVEVKNVTLLTPDGRHAFPDAVTARGRKHLEELTRAVAAGRRAVMLFVIQRTDGTAFTTARHIDPTYHEALVRAMAAGVEALAYRAMVSPQQVVLVEKVTVELET